MPRGRRYGRRRGGRRPMRRGGVARRVVRLRRGRRRL